MKLSVSGGANVEQVRLIDKQNVAVWTTVTAGGGALSMDDLTDADTVSTAPSANDVLSWTSPNWVPRSVAHESHMDLLPLTTGIVF